MEEEVPEKAKEPEKPKELEEDAPADSRKKLSEAVAWNMADSTLNVVPAFGGKVLMALSDSGFNHLLASVRANVGVKAGRYMFETKVLEQHNISAQAQGQRTPKTVIRIGLALAGSALLSSEEDNVFFDSEGFFVCGKKRIRTKQRFLKGSAVALLVNLDAASANANTVSVFVNGTRLCEPQALPESFKGKALYPVTTYKGVTLQVNFGPTAERALPFSCHMLGDAAAKDMEVAKVAPDGQREVLLPVGLPEQGAFDWADDFLAKNPSYTELSARKMLDWAVKSGLQRKGAKQSLDHPDMAFGLPGLDDHSVIALAKAIAPFHKRNFLVMELKNNLLTAERASTLAKFPGFKKRAAVLMGEPSPEYKAMVQGQILDAKKAQAEVERKKKVALAEVQARQKKVEAARKAKLAGKEPEEEVAEEKAAEEPEEPVTLTDEEKAIVFRKHESPDCSPNVVTKLFAEFSMPAKAEGFDAIDFLWQKEAGSTAHLKDFVAQRKLTSRVETLTPGDWFKAQLKEWNQLLVGWKKRQNEWKNPNLRKTLLAKIAADKKAAKAADAGEGEEAAKEEEEPMKIDAEDVEPSSVEDVNDIGSGEPLFANFAFEDWMLVSLRYELHLLVHAFKKDIDDAERTGFHESHLGFYYNKYFHKQWSTRTFGCNSLKDVVELIKENVAINKSSIVEALLAEDSATKGFVQLVEEHRRDRVRRIEAGVESAQLKFQKNAPNTPHQQQSHSNSGQKRPYAPGAHAAGQGPAWKQPRTIHATIQPRTVAPSNPSRLVQPTRIAPRIAPARITPQGQRVTPQPVRIGQQGQGQPQRIQPRFQPSFKPGFKGGKGGGGGGNKGGGSWQQRW